jgi:hypothetical protein
MSVALTLEDEVDVSRGDMLVRPSHPPHIMRRVDARVVWMNDAELEIGRKYLLRHTTRTVSAAVVAVRYRVNINTLDKEPANRLGLNDMGAVVIETQKPLFADPYRRNKATGSFILIDPISNATVAAGMITGREPVMGSPAPESTAGSRGRVSRAEQESRAGHRAVTVWLETTAETAFELERLLFDAGRRVHALAAGEAGASLPDLANALNDSGAIALIFSSGEPSLREKTRERVLPENFVLIEEQLTPEAIYRKLEEQSSWR